MSDLNWLHNMIADDDLGLLKIKKKTSALTADEQLVSKFNEINSFVTQHGHIPTENMANIIECMLASRLKAIRNNPDQFMALADFDEHNLLPKHQD
ncbi:MULTISPECIES: hypothetical protein [Snodgrassella]|uniref:hypothetical protein n=1 Tax=Snodgrassella TaxID=1193515 RepID=UPI001EF41615|nr:MULTISPECIES: hypothetical protein [Snodgrassella]MCO6517911.1 hypothetical protein [Snodgrassella sp.]